MRINVRFTHKRLISSPLSFSMRHVDSGEEIYLLEYVSYVILKHLYNTLNRVLCQAFLGNFYAIHSGDSTEIKERLDRESFP